MKRVLLFFFVFIFTFSFGGGIFANEAEELLDKWEAEKKRNGYYAGNPNETEILEKTKDYIVLRNITAKAEIYSSTMDMFESAEVFVMEAKKHCEKNDYFNVNIIPFTWNNTNLKNVRVNDFVNIEIDLLSRYLVNYQKQKEN